MRCLSENGFRSISKSIFDYWPVLDENFTILIFSQHPRWCKTEHFYRVAKQQKKGQTGQKGKCNKKHSRQSIYPWKL